MKMYLFKGVNIFVSGITGIIVSVNATALVPGKGIVLTITTEATVVKRGKHLPCLYCQ